MNKNEQFVITLNRELGSGGHTVGRLLAEKLHVTYYDKAVINALTDRLGMTVEEVEAIKGKKRSWWDEFRCGAGVQVFNGGMPQLMADYYTIENDMPATDEMFRMESIVLKEIAKSESCIVAGRSGFAIFQNWPNSMHIFIQASMEKRIARVIKRQGLSQQEAIAAIEKVDAGRENYLKKNVMTTRYDTRHYDLVLSMDHLTEEQAADIIFEFIEKQAE